MITVLTQGKRDEYTQRKFILSAVLPQYETVTAVFGIVFYKQKIVLTKNKKGWELLGGHVEQDESIDECLFREMHEEGGVLQKSIYRKFLLGYRKIIAKQKVQRQQGGYYPFPYSYIPHYICMANEPPGERYGSEIIDSKLYDRNEVMNNDTITSDTKEIIQYAYNLMYLS